MAGRPEDPENPLGGEPEDDEQGTSSVPGDMDERWAQIVAELRGSSDPRGWEPDPVVAEREDHFEPPDPGPVLGGDPLLTMAWGAVVGVPLLLLVGVAVWRDMPPLLLQGATAAFMVGLGLLLWRMPARRGDDDGPGAVV